MDTIFDSYKTVDAKDVQVWYKAADVAQFPENGGACIKYKGMQIAVFNFSRQNKWYACQNLCPHKMEMVISRGMIGSKGDIPKVACPLHKRNYSLIDGDHINGDGEGIAVYPVKIEDGYVYVGFEN